LKKAAVEGVMDPESVGGEWKRASLKKTEKKKVRNKKHN